MSFLTLNPVGFFTIELVFVVNSLKIAMLEEPFAFYKVVFNAGLYPKTDKPSSVRVPVLSKTKVEI